MSMEMGKATWSESKIAMFLAIFLVICRSRSAQGQVFIASFDMVIAQDGTGNFTTITEGIRAAPSFSCRRYYIKISAGIYDEHILINKDKTNLTIVGDGMDRSIITGERHKTDDNNVTTSESATVEVQGEGFVAWNITFQNTAGPENYQAVALLVASNYSAFYRCRITGFQDTLFAKKGYQFYRDCEIYGTVDFLFGDARAVFQGCVIYARKPLAGQANTVTAQGRDEKTSDGGFVIHYSIITTTRELQAVNYRVKTFLGRPWKDYSRTVFMQSYLDHLIDRQGWLQWDTRSPGLDTIYYAEYGNTGPGSSTSKRVKWKGFRVIDRTEATQFTVRNFIGGDKWIPGTQVPYFPDFIDENLKFSSASTYRSLCKLKVIMVLSMCLLASISL